MNYTALFQLPMIALLAFVGSAESSAQQPDAPASEQTQDRIERTHPLTRAPHGRYVIDVSIDGSVPLPFILDTGASHSAIPLVIARKLGYEAETTPLYGVDSLTERLETERHMVSVRLGDAAARDISPVVIDIGSESALGAFGILGADFFRGRVVRLDLTAEEFTVNAAPPERVDGRIPESAHVLTAQAWVRGVPGGAEVLIDTGANATLISPSLSSRLSQSETAAVRVIGLATRIERSETVRVLRELQIGGLCVRNRRLPEVDLHVFEAMGWPGAAMVMGLDFLQGAVITIDYANGVFQIDGPDDQDCTPRRG